MIQQTLEKIDALIHQRKSLQNLLIKFTRNKNKETENTSSISEYVIFSLYITLFLIRTFKEELKSCYIS